MADPQIQYAKTEDGVSIAYWTIGEGHPWSTCRFQREPMSSGHGQCFRSLFPVKLWELRWQES